LTLLIRNLIQRYADWYFVTFGTARRGLGGLRPLLIGVTNYGALGTCPLKLSHVHQSDNFYLHITPVGITAIVNTTHFLFQPQVRSRLFITHKFVWFLLDMTNTHVAPPLPDTKSGWLYCSSYIAVPNVTAHPSTASVPITVLLYNGPLLCGFNVPIKGSIWCQKLGAWTTLGVCGPLFPPQPTPWLRLTAKRTTDVDETKFTAPINK